MTCVSTSSLIKALIGVIRFTVLCKMHSQWYHKLTSYYLLHWKQSFIQTVVSVPLCACVCVFVYVCTSVAQQTVWVLSSNAMVTLTQHSAGSKSLSNPPPLSLCFHTTHTHVHLPRITKMSWATFHQSTGAQFFPPHYQDCAQIFFGPGAQYINKHILVPQAISWDNLCWWGAHCFMDTSKQTPVAAASMTHLTHLRSCGYLKPLPVTG